MILYHGTAASRIQSILTSGLNPRLEADGNWFTTVKSNSELVYMASDPDICEHYSLRAALVEEDRHGAVLSIDTSLLDESLFRVDENFIDLEERGVFQNCVTSRRIEQATEAALDTRWRESLSRFGGCSYLGTVPPSALSIHSVSPIEKNRFYRREFVVNGSTEANCRVQDAFISNFLYDTTRKTYVTADTRLPIGNWVNVIWQQ
jgi:hypothetical protein